MPKHSKFKAVSIIPPALRPVFEVKPLLYFECEEDYDALRAEVISSIAPMDSIEFIKAKEVTDAIWEATRLIRLQHDAVAAELPKAVHDLIGDLFANKLYNERGLDEESAKQDVFTRARMATQKTGPKRPLRDLLKLYHVDEQMVHAMAFKAALPFIERIISIREAVQQRGEKALRSIDQRRVSLATQTRILAPPKARPLAEDVAEFEG